MYCTHIYTPRELEVYYICVCAGYNLYVQVMYVVRLDVMQRLDNKGVYA